MKSALILALALTAGPLAHSQDTPPTPNEPQPALRAPRAEPAPRPAKAEDPTRAADAPRPTKAPSAQRGIPTPPIAAAGAPPAAPAFPGTPGNAVGEALLLEETSTDLESAVRRYEQAIRQYDQQREAAGMALLRLAEIQRKQKQTEEAVQLYRRVVTEFSDQKRLADTARQRLDTIPGGRGGRMSGFGGGMAGSQAFDPGSAGSAGNNLDQQRELLKQEIGLVQDQIDATKKAIDAGAAQYNAAWENERELLKLKRELAALDGRVKPDLAELSTGGGVSSTSANIPGSSANTITGTAGGSGSGSFGSEGAGGSGMGGGAAGTMTATVPLNERLAASASGRVPTLGDIPKIGRLYQTDASRDQSFDAKFSRIVGEIDMLESELQRLRWEVADVESEVETVQSIPVQNLSEETARSASFSRLKEQYAQSITAGDNDEDRKASQEAALEGMEKWKNAIYLPEKEAQLRALQIKKQSREILLITAKKQLAEMQEEIKKAEAEAAARKATSVKPTPMSPELMKRYGLTPEAEQKKF